MRTDFKIKDFIRRLLLSTADYYAKKKLLAEILAGYFLCKNEEFNDNEVYELVDSVIQARNNELNSPSVKVPQRLSGDNITSDEDSSSLSDVSKQSSSDDDINSNEDPQSQDNTFTYEQIENLNIDSIFDSVFTWLRLIKFEIESANMLSLLRVFFGS